MKAVVLAGGQEFGQCPLSRQMPRAMWPVLDRCILEHVLGGLRSAGIGQASISANGQTQRIAEALAARPMKDIGVHYSEDERPRGAAGCVKDCEAWLGEETFLVVHGASLLLKIDFEHLLREHRRTRAVMTIATDSRGHHGAEPAGLYVCEKAIFPYIAPRGYQDMKEQLIPRLSEAGLAVQAVGLRGRVVPILNEECYLNALIELLERPEWHAPLAAHLPAPLPTLWVDAAAVVHPEARIVGPAYVGPNVTIGADAMVIGPVQIGAGCRVDADAVVHESILWPGARVGAGAVVEQSIVAGGAHVAAGEDVRGTIVLAGDRAIETPCRAEGGGASPWRRLFTGIGPVVKRAT